MDNHDLKTILTAVDALAKRASAPGPQVTALEAMQLAQAACNLANTAVAISHIKH